MNKLCVVLICCLLAGCAGVPIVQFDRSKSVPHSIALVSVVQPKTNFVVNFGGASSAFGLIGGLIQGGINESHSNTYTEMVKQNNVSFSEMVTSSLAKQLEAKGYTVVLANDVTVPLAADGKDFDYSSITANADAILHVWYTVDGYVSPSSSTSFQPWVIIRARLINRKSKADLYLRTLRGGWTSNTENVTNLACGEQYRYSNFDQLIENFQQSVEGLRNCTQQLVAQIAEDIAPGH